MNLVGVITLGLLNAVFPLIAWTVCFLLLSIPGLFFTVFAFSLLGHLSQFIWKDNVVER
jgi:hypothetical protein